MVLQLAESQACTLLPLFPAHLIFIFPDSFFYPQLTKVRLVAFDVSLTWMVMVDDFFRLYFVEVVAFSPFLVAIEEIAALEMAINGFFRLLALAINEFALFEARIIGFFLTVREQLASATNLSQVEVCARPRL